MSAPLSSACRPYLSEDPDESWLARIDGEWVVRSECIASVGMAVAGEAYVEVTARNGQLNSVRVADAVLAMDGQLLGAADLSDEQIQQAWRRVEA